MAKKRSITEQAFSEIKRIERLAKRAEKRGYTFNLPYRFTKTGKEKTRFTKAELEQLKQVRTKDLYKYGSAFGVSAEEYRKRERSESARKAARTRRERKERRETKRWQQDYSSYESISTVIISNFLNPYNWMHAATQPKIIEIATEYINKRIEMFGEWKVAMSLEGAAKDGVLSEIQRSYAYNVRKNLDALEEYYQLYDDTYSNLVEANEEEYEDDEEYQYDEELFQ